MFDPMAFSNQNEVLQILVSLFLGTIHVIFISFMGMMSFGLLFHTLVGLLHFDLEFPLEEVKIWFKGLFNFFIILLVPGWGVLALIYWYLVPKAGFLDGLIKFVISIIPIANLYYIGNWVVEIIIINYNTVLLFVSFYSPI